jgi:hypothetical protein
LEDIPQRLNDLLFNTKEDKKFETIENQLKERERLLITLGTYLYQDSKCPIGDGKICNWPEVVKIIFYNRFPEIAQTHKIIDSNDGYNIQLNDLIQYAK